ncbi:unnamed protein product [Alternaria alternata]
MPTSITPEQQLARLTKLPSAPGSPTGTFPSGRVSLYKNSSWTSQKLDLETKNYHSGTRHTIPGSALRDEVSWVAWCLPVGTVMTLMEHDTPRDEAESVANLRDCGRCVDLVGTGKVQTANLIAFNMNDFYGAIELFEASDFQGVRIAIFLSEWNSDHRIDISQWWLNDRVSSMRWKSLVDRQTAEVSQHGDGTGKRFDNLLAWQSNKEMAKMTDIAFNDGVSSVKWTAVVPCKEIIHPFKMTPDPQGGFRLYRGTNNGRNNTNVSQQSVVRIHEEKAQSITISTSDQYVSGISSSFSLSTDSPYVSAEWTVTVDYSYTHKEESSTTETRTFSLDVEQTVNAPPMTVWDAELLVKLADIPAKYYTTTATRWYDKPLVGALADSANNGWYKREENVGVTISGGLAFDVFSNINANPI